MSKLLRHIKRMVFPGPIISMSGAWCQICLVTLRSGDRFSVSKELYNTIMEFISSHVIEPILHRNLEHQPSSHILSNAS